jgi:hypothetical protein
MSKGLEKVPNLHALQAGDEVAIVPIGKADSDGFEIIAVAHVRAFTIQLANGKLYARTDGRGLVTNDSIQPATDSHKSEIERRGKQR